MSIEPSTVQELGEKTLTSKDLQALSILFSTGSLIDTSSGPYHSLRRTAECLAAQGDKVTVLGTLAPNETILGRWGNASVYGFRKFGPRSLHWAPGVNTWLRKSMSAADIVSLQSVWLHINSEVAKWATARQVPYIISAHGNFNPAALQFSRYKKFLATSWFVRDMLAGAACMHALNDAEALAIRAYGIRSPVAVIPNGVDLPSVDRQALAVATHQAVQRDQRVCLYLGRLHRIKNLEVMIEAWGRLPKSANAWTLVVAGDGDARYTRSLVRHVKTHSRTGAIKFIGRIDGSLKSEWLSRAELFVLPSTSEGLPMAPLEAMAHGVPVILTRQCNLPDVAVSGAGRLCEQDVESLLHTLGEMTGKSAAELMDMGDRARQIVAARYSWDRVIEQLRSTYSWMLGKEACPEWVSLY